MNNKEAELVTKEFVKEDTNYNLCPGGNGGFGYINENIMTPEFRSHLGNIGGICKKTHITGYREMLNDPKRAAKRNKSISNTRKKRFMSGDIINGFHNKNHSAYTKNKMSEIHKKNKHQQGNKNSQFGKRWIYSLEEKRSTTIGKDEPLLDGWFEGRKIKF